MSDMKKFLAAILVVINISLAGCGGGGGGATTSSTVPSTGSDTVTNSGASTGTGTSTSPGTTGTSTGATDTSTVTAGTSPGTTGTGTGATAQPTSAVLKLSTEGVLASGEALAGVGVTVNLPAGVTIATDSTGQAQSSVVTVSGVAVPGSLVAPQYTPATATAPGSLKFTVASTAAGGFGVGEFATVTCKVSSGSFPKSTDFTLSDVTTANLLLKPAGLTGVYSATIQ